tara:strand:+ start:2725 stop:2979 length:255 start_codon:yes stop_codon:yes gene_type:complete
MEYDKVRLEDLCIDPGFKGLVYSLCGLNNDPDMLTTTDKFRVSCVEALRLGYLLSKYLGVDQDEFIEGVLAVMETEDHLEERYH